MIAYGDSDPEHEALLADSVGLALLVVLETLSPAERLAFVLHDMFGMPFEEIAPIVERNVAATRQLASRARRGSGAPTDPTPESLAQQRKVVEAFLHASRNGDFEELLELLDPDIVFRADAGAARTGGSGAAQRITGRRELVLARGTPMAPFGRPGNRQRQARCRGRCSATASRSVVAFTIVGDRVTEMDLLVDPVKLSEVRPPAA